MIFPRRSYLLLLSHLVLVVTRASATTPETCPAGEFYPPSFDQQIWQRLSEDFTGCTKSSCKSYNTRYRALEDTDKRKLCIKKECPLGSIMLPDKICALCPSGFYTTIEQKNCTKVRCPAGKYQTGGNTGLKCENCPVGLYSPPDSIECRMCPLGWQVSEFSRGHCSSKCQTQRTQYSGGYVWNEDSQSCRECPQGFFSGINDVHDACLACPKGQHQPKRGQNQCLNCTSFGAGTRTASPKFFRAISGSYSASKSRDLEGVEERRRDWPMNTHTKLK